ncbi:Hypothetical predicted protein [Olea europaea subsp. europaea]|uniref:Uncharacterized protein n=1 Tax=Olea europaea subsp. europaea TaxID=158383 RepID=A0A8S0SJL6_OLEEU|nr:Hypothetical predicted protein [Olea europaea subsp. europaea]
MLDVARLSKSYSMLGWSVEVGLVMHACIISNNFFDALSLDLEKVFCRNNEEFNSVACSRAYSSQFEMKHTAIFLLNAQYFVCRLCSVIEYLHAFLELHRSCMF